MQTWFRFCQVLKGAVGATLCQNEAELKFSMEMLGLWMSFGGQFPAKILVLPHSGRGTSQLLLYTLPSKRNATLGPGAPMTPIWGQRPHRGKKLLKGVVSSISSHRYDSKSGKVPLLMTF